MRSFICLLFSAGIVILAASCEKNQPAEIISITASDSIVTQGSKVELLCKATDLDNDEILYYWDNPDGGSFEGRQDSSGIIWTAPYISGNYIITCNVSDGFQDISMFDSVIIKVVEDYFPLTLHNIQVYTDTLSDYFGNPFSDYLVTEIITCVESLNFWQQERFHLLDFQGSRELLGIDTVSYRVAGDSILIDDHNLENEYLGFLFPLWVGKTWETGEGGTGTVLRKDEVSVPWGDFKDCYQVVFSEEVFNIDFWVAPNIGIIQFSYTLIGKPFVYDTIFLKPQLDTTNFNIDSLRHPIHI